MEIRQLEYFRAIVDAGTISGAARELHMTQPPLSYQMKIDVYKRQPFKI